jgi:outer membrane protein assembly factor BamB
VPTLYGDLVALDAATGTERWRVTGGPSPIHTTHYRAARRAGFEASPILTGDLVWIAGTDGALVALDLRTGGELWRTAIGAPVLAGAALAGDTLVVASYDGTVRALSTAVAPRPALDATDTSCAAGDRGHRGVLVIGLALGIALALGAVLFVRRRRRMASRVHRVGG